MNFLSHRLASHGLDRSRFSTPAEVVRHYGCIQAQDIGQAIWVIGSRIEGSTEDIVREACRDGSIIRTWPMRGTLHYMDPSNAHWMLALCASKTLPGFVKRREFLAITESHAEKALEIVERELRGGKSLTRTALGTTLEAGGIPMQTQWTYHLACYAATRGLICFGPPTEKEETFVLLDEWVKHPKILTRDEELAELTRMYFRGHSPATVDDFAWWCGLGKTECKKAVNLIEGELEKIEYEGKTYYQFPIPVIASEIQGSTAIQDSKNSTLDRFILRDDGNIKLLGGFDEYFLGYKDRSVVAERESHSKLFTTNGIFFPLIVQNGKVIGNWKREWKKDRVIIKPELLPGVSLDPRLLEDESRRYARFFGYEKWEIT